MSNEGILVVGGNSYIGKHFARYAEARGVHLEILNSTNCNLLRPHHIEQAVNRLLHRSWSLFFFAVVNKSSSNTFESYKDNIDIAKNAVHYFSRLNLSHLTYLSSVDVYGKDSDLPITESSRINPDTWYGLAKYSAEWIFANSGEITCPVAVARIPGVFGSGEHDRSVIGKFASELLSYERVTISGTGHDKRDYVYVEDLSKILYSLAEQKFSGVLNIATGISRPISDIAQILVATIKEKAEIISDQQASPRSFDLIFDNSKLRTVLPEFRFTDLHQALLAYKKNP